MRAPAGLKVTTLIPTIRLKNELLSVNAQRTSKTTCCMNSDKFARMRQIDLWNTQKEQLDSRTIARLALYHCRRETKELFAFKVCKLTSTCKLFLLAIISLRVYNIVSIKWSDSSCVKMRVYCASQLCAKNEARVQRKESQRGQWKESEDAIASTFRYFSMHELSLRLTRTIVNHFFDVLDLGFSTCSLVP